VWEKKVVAQTPKGGDDPEVNKKRWGNARGLKLTNRNTTKLTQTQKGCSATGVLRQQPSRGGDGKTIWVSPFVISERTHNHLREELARKKGKAGNGESNLRFGGPLKMEKKTFTKKKTHTRGPY